MSDLLDPRAANFVAEVEVLIVGGGGCGLTAALAARQAGAEVLVLERDSSPRGTTAMSTGLIPGAASRLQQARGIDDSAAQFAADIVAKARGATDAEIVRVLASESGRTVDWLIDAHDVPLSLVDTFLYPGHSALRMHGTPNRTGAELMVALCNAVARRGVDVLTDARVTHLFMDAERVVRGVRYLRPDGSCEDVACAALVLACCGFAGNRAMVTQYLPELEHATFHGHPGNQGDAIRWGRALGASLCDLSGYQGHGGLAVGHAIPILWPVIMHGGVQVNAHGERFSNEARGYSEQAVDVLAQPGHVAWTVFDERVHGLMQEFDDYRDALEARAVLAANDIDSLATAMRVPRATLAQTLAEVALCADRRSVDRFGRTFSPAQRLQPPYRAVRVTGALFHTQGGLAVDDGARVLHDDGRPFANLYAGGGAARGVSGPSCWGYLAGNGLLTATTLGRIAGAGAAASARLAVVGRRHQAR